MKISKAMKLWYNGRYQLLKSEFEDNAEVFWYESENTLWKYTRKQTIAGWILGAIKDVHMEKVVVLAEARSEAEGYCDFVMSKIVEPLVKYDNFEIMARNKERISLSNGTTIYFAGISHLRMLRGLTFNLCIGTVHEKEMKTFAECLQKNIFPVLRMKDAFFVLHITTLAKLEEQGNLVSRMIEKFEGCVDNRKDATKKRERQGEISNILMSTPRKKK